MTTLKPMPLSLEERATLPYLIQHDFMNHIRDLYSFAYEYAEILPIDRFQILLNLAKGIENLEDKALVDLQEHLK